MHINRGLQQLHLRSSVQRSVPKTTRRLFVKMGNKMFLFLAVFVLLALVENVTPQIGSKSGFCPLAASVKQCVPRCHSDFICSGSKKCCPNACGTQSCADYSPVSSGGRQTSNTYCGNRKCKHNEKCVIDRTTKREKCVPI